MTKRRKGDNDVIIQLIGGQSEQVTGSVVSVSYMTEEGREHFLVDMGGVQGFSKYEEYLKNKKLIESIPIKFAKFCFISHNHCDHTMLIPSLSNHGFEGKIITTEVNSKIIKPMLEDSTKIHIADCEYLKSKGKKVRYLYSKQDLYSALDRIETYEIGEIHKLNNYVSFRFLNNSHVVGATQIEFYIKKYGTNRTKKIVYTGDLGNTDNFKHNYFLKETEIVGKTDVLLIESTYGQGDRNFNKKQCLEERKDLAKTITQFVNGGNSVLIPVFSYSRLQNTMCWLYTTFKDSWDMKYPIVIDTNLGNKMNSVYENILEDEDKEFWKEVMNWRAFKFIKDFQGTMSFLSSKQNALILSSSGMISGGKSVLYAKQMLNSSRNAILFCGYCGDNTLGASILDDKLDKVEVEGETLLKRCFIKKYNSFSSHASQKDLINYIKQCNCGKVVLHHGSPEAKEELKKVADVELSKLNRTTKVLISEKDMIIRL